MASWRRNRRRRSWRERLNSLKAGVLAGTRRGAMPVLAMLLGFGSVVGGDEAVRRVRESPRFLLRQVRIQGEGDLSAEEVMAACGLRLGETRVWGLDEGETALRCQGDLRIRWARVETRLPDTVLVTLRREDPILLVATPWGLSWLSREGDLVSPWDPLEGPSDLPMLISAGEGAVAWTREVLSQVVTLVGLHRRIEGVRSLTRIEWDPALGARIYMGDERGGRGETVVHLGLGPYRRKMQRLEMAISVARQMNLPLDEVRVNGAVRPNRVVIRPSFAGAIVQNDALLEEVRGMP